MSRVRVKMNEGRNFISLYQRACCAGRCYVLVAREENSITPETKYKEECNVVLLVQHSRQAQESISVPCQAEKTDKRDIVVVPDVAGVSVRQPLHPTAI